MPNQFKRTAVLLSAALLLCGCNFSEHPAAEEDPVSTEAPAPTETSAPEKETDVTPEKQPDTLDTVTFKKLTNARLVCDEKVRELVYLPDTLTHDNIRYVSDTELYLPNRRPNFRTSCREMGENALSDAKKMVSISFWSSNAIDTNLSLRIGEMDSAYLIPVESAQAEYYLYFNEPRVFRGFLRQTLSGVECVIDPAYMNGIPLLSRDEKDLTFSINGETMYADTISLTIENEIIEPIVGAGNDRYVYAEFSLYSLEIRYDTESGYHNKGSYLIDAKLLTEDTASVISGDFIFGQESESAGEAALLYDSLLNGFDALYTDETCGIVLLDMDFDGSPEVLVSRRGADENSEPYADVDVYRYEDGSFVYLDTIRSIANTAHGEYFGCSAYLGLKTLSDGSKAWFGMTNEYIIDDEKGGHRESGKLFRLENGKIREEEVFSFWQNLGESYGLTICINGKPIDSLEGDKGALSELSEDPSASYFDLKNRYCADIEEKIFLYSDWLIPITRLENQVYLGSEPLSPSARDIAIHLGRLVDSYYYGDYSAEYDGYVYYFNFAPAMKPVVYLYPEEETEVSVSVDFPNGGEFTCTYPEYGEGWRVTALPDGTLFDENGDEYYCLYWEGAGLPLCDSGEGWCVLGENTADFLREKLLGIGLTAREANEMIIYWLPQMQGNPYNRISFHFEDYDRAAPLTVSPAPDTLIRVFMTYSPSEEWVEMKPQTLPRYERKGFTLVEWGGCDLIL